MDDLLDMIASEESPTKITDKIKDILYAKASERVDAYKPSVANSLFNSEVEDSAEESSD